MSNDTLEEALASGQGIERPFKCSAHDDQNASASVNVVLGVWYCYACRASGKVGDKKKAPSLDLLRAMMEPETSVREYPNAFLELFAAPDYWLDRFPAWLCWNTGLGNDPFTGDATFPVHTPSGRLAGVGRRREQGEPRYRYPHNWAASRVLAGDWYICTPTRAKVVVLTEGYADAAAVWECGVPGYGCYGSGIHLPQIETLAAKHPAVVLLGFDMDEAGERATDAAHDTLGHLFPLYRVEWSHPDPAATPVGERLEDIERSVRAAGYGAKDEVPRGWVTAVADAKAAYESYLEESA
jgi:hypothetical protein